MRQITFWIAKLSFPLFAFVAFCVISTNICYSGETGPLGALTFIQKGIDTQDFDLFSKGIDIDEVLTSIMTDGKEELKKISNFSNKKNQQFLFLKEAFDEDGLVSGPLRFFIAQEIKKCVRVGVVSGYFSGNPDSNSSTEGGIFFSFLKNLVAGRKQIIPGKVIEATGNDAIVTASYQDSKNIIPLSLKVKKDNNGWRIKQILNLHELFSQATKNAY